MTNNPFSALIAGVPRYSFTGERLIKSADGAWLYREDVLAALEAATPPNLAEEAVKALEGVPDGLEVVCGDVCADGVAMPLALVPDEYPRFARFIAKAPNTIRTLIAMITAQAAQIAGLTKERDNLADKLELERALTDGAHRRAKAAEAEAATLRAEVERLRGVAKALEKAASEVSRRGAETGPQWSKLTIAILQTRAALENKT